MIFEASRHGRGGGVDVLALVWLSLALRAGDLGPALPLYAAAAPLELAAG